MLLAAIVAAIRLLRPLKPVALVVFPSLAAAIVKPTDLIYVVVISVICTLLAVSAFVNSYVNFESRFVQWFSHLTSSPRWFTMWLLVMALWVPTRHILAEHGLLSNDTDFVVATILWSCVPYMVENVLKSTSARAMETIAQLVLEVQASQERAEKKDDLMLATLDKIFEAIKAPEGVSPVDR